MRITVASVKSFLIILRKVLRILFILEILNFFYLFMIFRILFLIICENDFTTYLYSKFFISLKSVCNFFRKKLCCSISAFFCVMRAACHLKQLLNYVIISE